MQPVRLDFVAQSATPRWVPRLLLAIAIVVAGDTALSFIKTKRNISEKQSALAKVEPRNYQAPKEASREEIAAARETMQRLATPWDKLFGALEQAASDQVALLGIEPDPRAGTVTIRGDSKDYLATLTYVLNLSRAPALSHVQLARHETRGNDRTVGFSVQANWTEKR